MTIVWNLNFRVQFWSFLKSLHLLSRKLLFKNNTHFYETIMILVILFSKRFWRYINIYENSGKVCCLKYNSMSVQVSYGPWIHAVLHAEWVCTWDYFWLFSRSNTSYWSLFQSSNAFRTELFPLALINSLALIDRVLGPMLTTTKQSANTKTTPFFGFDSIVQGVPKLRKHFKFGHFSAPKAPRN